MSVISHEAIKPLESVLRVESVKHNFTIDILLFFSRVFPRAAKTQRAEARHDNKLSFIRSRQRQPALVMLSL